SAPWPRGSPLEHGDRTSCRPSANAGQKPGAPRDLPMLNLAPVNTSFGWSMRPWESVPPLGGAAGGLPGSHGPSDRSTVAAKGERMVKWDARDSVRPPGAARGVVVRGRVGVADGSGGDAPWLFGLSRRAGMTASGRGFAGMSYVPALRRWTK